MWLVDKGVPDAEECRSGERKAGSHKPQSGATKWSNKVEEHSAVQRMSAEMDNNY
jgi:hypothetical protein